MPFTTSTSSGYDRTKLHTQVFTASGTVLDETRVVVINSTTARTITFPAIPDSGVVLFITNVSSTSSAATHTLTAASGVTWDGTNQSITLAPGGKLIAVSVDTTQYEIFRIGNESQVLTADGAISVPTGRQAVVVLAKSSATAATLAAPVVGQDDFKSIIITAGTAQAHTVTQTTPGFNNASTSGDVATFGGAIGDSMVVVSYNGKWNVVSLRNVTLA